MTTSHSKNSLRSCIAQRDRNIETWSTHVDEIAEWAPAHQSFDEWIGQLLNLYSVACEMAVSTEVVAVALSFEPSSELTTFRNLGDIVVDFFTPPSLYILKQDLTFPSAGEEYYRVLSPIEIDRVSIKGFVIARSARSLQGLQSGWEFDNTIYVASGFGK